MFRNAVSPCALIMQSMDLMGGGYGMDVFSNGVNWMYLMETGSISNRSQPRIFRLPVANLIAPLRKVA